jgi:hypothetical protein
MKRRIKMSLDLTFHQVQDTQVGWINITHNLNDMAKALGVYQCLWHPEEIAETVLAKDIEPLVKAAAEKLALHPEEYFQYESENGWGTLAGFKKFLAGVLEICREFPDSRVAADR